MTLTTTPNPFKYEVAFSYLKEDEAIVQELNDHFKGQLRTFIYTQRQDVLGGTDGTEAFPEVFGTQARIVVIMYRENWGKTKWTRIEEQAIKERMLEDGQEFIVLINLDNGKPKWYSGTRIRVAKQYGMIEAAAIIRNRIEQYGGVIHEESVPEQFARHERELQARLNLANFLRSEEAVRQANAEWNKLYEAVGQYANALNNGAIGYTMGFSRHPKEHIICFGQQVALGFLWKLPYVDSLEGSSLTIELAHGDHFDPPRYDGRVYKRVQYRYSLNSSGQGVWRNTEDENDYMTTEQVIQLWFKPFLEMVKDALLENQKHRFQVL